MRIEEFETTVGITWPSLMKDPVTILCKFKVVEKPRRDEVVVVQTEVGHRNREDKWIGIEASWIWDIIPHVERNRWDRQMLAIWDKNRAIYTELGAEVA